MDELDETYTSWMRDVRLAKARTIIPADYLKRSSAEMIPGAGKQLAWDFDSDVETFVALDMHDENGNIPSITMQQFEIRSQEHMATCNELLTKIVSIAGYAPQTFGMDIVGMAQSGTALHIREKKSYDTRGKKETYWKSTLQDIMTAMIHLDNALWPDKGSDADDQVKVRFADSFANDISTMANAVSLLNAANAASTEVKVRMLHPDWTQKQVADEVERLKTSEHLLLYNSQLMTKEQFLRYYYADDEAEMKQAIAEVEAQDEQQQEQDEEQIKLEDNNRKHVKQNIEEEYSSDNQQTVTGNTTAG
jgi:A118 family predicted phage portal protein